MLDPMGLSLVRAPPSEPVTTVEEDHATVERWRGRIAVRSGAPLHGDILGHAYVVPARDERSCFEAPIGGASRALPASRQRFGC